MKLKCLAILCFLTLSSAAFTAEEIIKRKNYILNYNEDHEIANWVSYELDRFKLQNCASRANIFKDDPLISTGSSTNEDYRGSGYDRGHLLPAGDMKFSREAMNDTFYFSNMTPQPPKFNRGRWAQLERLMRSWALNYKKVWIVTGPVLETGLAVIGKVNVVSIPKLYFKVILRRAGNSYEGIGFLMSTDVPHSDLKSYATSINKIEEMTDYDFFGFLSNEVEENIEGEINTADWDFNAKFEYLPCQASVVQ